MASSPITGIVITAEDENTITSFNELITILEENEIEVYLYEQDTEKWYEYEHYSREVHLGIPSLIRLIKHNCLVKGKPWR